VGRLGLGSKLFGIKEENTPLANPPLFIDFQRLALDTSQCRMSRNAGVLAVCIGK